MPEPPFSTPSRPSVARRFARSVEAHDAALRPAPVVLLRALADVVVGRESAPGGGGVEDDGGPDAPRSGEHSQKNGGTSHARPARAALSVVAVAVCVGAFAGPSPASDGEAGVGRASVAAVVALRSRAETARAADGSSTPEVRGLAPSPIAQPDSARRADLASRAAALRQRPALPPGLPVGAPVAGVVSSPFGPRRHPVSGRLRGHSGTDFAVPLRTPVRATADGRVLAVGVRSGYGLTVEVEHRDPSGLATSTLYAHLNATTIMPGAPIRRGTVVGLSGGVGFGAGVSTGPHVHYEVRERGSAEAIDPSVLYDRVRAWSAETARRRHELATVIRTLRRAQTEQNQTSTPHTAPLSP